MADIEHILHQVKVPESDRGQPKIHVVAKWRFDSQTDRITSHPFGATSSPICAALALNQTIESNLASHDERTLNLAKCAFYVDDCLLSLNSLEEVSKMAKCLGALT